MSTGYFNKDGARIAAEDWSILTKESGYSNVMEYDNGAVRVRVTWVGKVVSIESLFPDMYKVFRLDVYNYNAVGGLVSDPVSNGKWFPNKDAAIKAYEEFLVQWTASHKNEEGEFVEEDNFFAPPPPPPPPPSPDAPLSDLATIKGVEDDGVGAW